MNLCKDTNSFPMTHPMLVKIVIRRSKLPATVQRKVGVKVDKDGDVEMEICAPLSVQSTSKTVSVTVQDMTEQPIARNERMDKIVVDPYNPLNVPITESDVYQILRKYGLNFKINNFKIYQRAFVHRSYVRHSMTENDVNNISLAPQPPHCIS